MTNEMTYDIIMNLISCLIGAILGYFISLYFYKKSEIKINLVCEVETEFMKDHNFFISHITITNEGSQFCRHDFARLQPLALFSDEYFFNLLEESSLFHSNQDNYFSAKYYSTNSTGTAPYDKIELIYDFIEKNEKITCTLYHTGELHISGRPRRGRVLFKEVKKEIGTPKTIWEEIKDDSFVKCVSIIIVIVAILIALAL